MDSMNQTSMSRDSEVYDGNNKNISLEANVDRLQHHLNINRDLMHSKEANLEKVKWNS